MENRQIINRSGRDRAINQVKGWDSRVFIHRFVYSKLDKKDKYRAIRIIPNSKQVNPKKLLKYAMGPFSFPINIGVVTTARKDNNPKRFPQGYLFFFKEIWGPCLIQKFMELQII